MDHGRLPVNASFGWVIPPLPQRYETLLASAGVLAGGGLVAMVIAAWRQRKPGPNPGLSGRLSRPGNPGYAETRGKLGG